MVRGLPRGAPCKLRLTTVFRYLRFVCVGGGGSKGGTGKGDLGKCGYASRKEPWPFLALRVSEMLYSHAKRVSFYSCTRTVCYSFLNLFIHFRTCLFLGLIFICRPWAFDEATYHRHLAYFTQERSPGPADQAI